MRKAFCSDAPTNLSGSNHSQINNDTDLQKKIYPSRLTSMTSLPTSALKAMDERSSNERLHNSGSLTKLELSDGNSLYSKLELMDPNHVLGSWQELKRLDELLPECNQHTKENRCAWQRFLPAGPIALLPIGDRFSNIVWTMDPNESSTRKLMNEDEFVKAVNHALDNGYGPHPQSRSSGGGDIFSWFGTGVTSPANERFELPPKVVKLASERMVLPLSLMHSNRYASKRVALIGDAANTVHSSCWVSLLRKYEVDRKTANVTMMAILDGFQKAYSVDFAPLNVLRAAAFYGAHYIPPLKRSIISYASGEQRLPLFG